MARKQKKTKQAAAKSQTAVVKAEESPQSIDEQLPQSLPEVASQVVTDSAVKVKETVDVEMENVKEGVLEVANAASQFVEEMNGIDKPEEREAGPSMITQRVTEAADAASQFVETMTNTEETPQQSMTIEERQKKINELRQRMRESAQANRSAVIKEATTHKVTIRDQARLEKQRQLAEILRSKAQAEEDGREDGYERSKNWEYTIEENDQWEKKLKRKKNRSDFQFHDEADQARRKYKKDLDLLKPDLVAYNKQKEEALGLAPGTLVHTTDAGKQVATTSSQQQLAAENLYRDANTLLYADNKPTEEAIDRVVSKMNKDIDKRNKFSRKRNNEDDELITYINERNRVFNKKIARYYDKYTEEIRASFERGTAL